MSADARLTLLLLGATAMGNAIVAVFFLHYWRKTRDRFFGLFAAAFGLLMVNRVLLAIHGGSEHEYLIYVIRLFAFVVILFAIIDKNRAAQSG